MNTRKKITISTSLISFALIALYASVLAVIYTQARKSTNQTLSSYLTLAERAFDGKNSEESGKKLEEEFHFDSDSQVRVSIIEKTDTGYRIDYDSRGMTLAEETPAELSEDKLGLPYVRKSSYGYRMIYEAEKDHENPLFFVRVSIRESEALSTSRRFLLIGTPLFALLLVAYIAYQTHLYRKNLLPISQEIGKLGGLSGETGSAIPDDDVLLLSESIKRVSEKMQNQMNQLYSEQERIHSILDSVSQAFLALNGKGEIILFNSAAELLFSFDRKDVLGKPYQAISQDSNLLSSIKNCLSIEKDVPPLDISLDGKYYSVTVMSLSPLSGEGKKRGAALLLEDVTAKKDVLRIKQDFFTNASHELKSPLTTILGYQEMIQSGILTSEKDIKDANEKTIREAKRMKLILDDMSVLNRIEGGKEKKDIKPIRIDLLLTDIENSFLPRLKEKGIALSGKKEELTVPMDEEDARRVFTNLLDNGVKYNRENGSIEVDCTSSGIVKVKDSGIGIREQDLSRIFERFYRVDNSRGKDTPDGSGLGLSIVKHILESYQDTIKVSSLFGAGTTFEISLKK